MAYITAGSDIKVFVGLSIDTAFIARHDFGFFLACDIVAHDIGIMCVYKSVCGSEVDGMVYAGALVCWHARGQTFN